MDDNDILKLFWNRSDEAIAETLYDLLGATNWASESTSVPAGAEGDTEPLFTILFEEGYGLRVYQHHACAYDEREMPLGLVDYAYYMLPDRAVEAVAAYAAEHTENSETTDNPA